MTARGILTLSNGSIISQELPKGFILTGKDGIEIVTDAAVFVPAGNANGYGIATVSAHALVSGLQGNLRAFAIDQVYGTSLYIRNLRSFTGGQEAYTVTFITSQDRQISLSHARGILALQTISRLLFHPCVESVTGTTRFYVNWICQFVRYDIPDLPGVKVLHAHVVGKAILLEVVFVARLRILTAK
jgi:hypothetical protein